MSPNSPAEWPCAAALTWLAFFSDFLLASCLASVAFTFVMWQWISWGEDFSTLGTWKWYSFQVVCLNVVANSIRNSLFSTNFANESHHLFGRPICLRSIWNTIFTFLHQWLHLHIQCSQVGNGYCPRNFSFISYIGHWTSIVCCWCHKQFFDLFHWFGNFRFFLLGQQIRESLVREPFQFQFLSNCKEGVHVFLTNICFTKVEEVKNRYQVFWLKPLEVD